MSSKRKWKKAGLFYFGVVFFLIPTQALAYIDPSVTSYAVQALAGVIVAAGAFFAAYGRKTRKLILKGLGIDDVSGKPQEPKAAIYLEELREETESRKVAFEASNQKKTTEIKGKGIRCLILSLICGLAVAITIILHPCISFYLSNEGEFWFTLGSVIGKILLIFGGVAGITALIHAILPDKKIRSPRLLFATVIMVIAVCAFIQYNAMSSYLPVLDGSPIDWSKYSKWGWASTVLWGGMLILLIAGFIWRPKATKVLVYSALVLLLCTEIVTGGYSLITARHENSKTKAYFSAEGLYETSEAGNIVILVSDTFEGTYMNEILERYPEYQDMLNDITYYDNVTGVSVHTYFSYAQFLTGIDYPQNAESEEGLRYCFEHETTVDTVYKNDWDIGYYTLFSPTENVKEKIVNYCCDDLTPDSQTAWKLTGNIIKSTLFRSMPQFAKSSFMVYTSDYERLKENLGSRTEIAQPYVEDDQAFYEYVKSNNFKVKPGKPKYSVIQLWGIHEPCNLNAEHEIVEYDEDVSIWERQIEGGRAQLKLLREYLDSLKRAGTYDNTTVIMMADHGFDMRFYPVFLVKEAYREADGFKIDNTPLSVREDLEILLSKLTTGKNVSQALQEMNIDANRTRHVVLYRGEEYDKKNIIKSIVAIEGEAKDSTSYRVEKDEFLIDDQSTKQYTIGIPFVAERNISDNVNAYGLLGVHSIGHTVLFDIFLADPAEQDLMLKMRLTNEVNTDQKVIVCMDGKNLTEENIPYSENKDLVVSLPVQGKDRIQIEIQLPDAELRKMENEELGWVDYNSILIEDAVIEQP